MMAASILQLINIWLQRLDSAELHLLRAQKKKSHIASKVQQLKKLEMVQKRTSGQRGLMSPGYLMPPGERGEYQVLHSDRSDVVIL